MRKRLFVLCAIMVALVLGWWALRAQAQPTTDSPEITIQSYVDNYVTWFPLAITIEVPPGQWTGNPAISVTGSSGISITLSSNVSTTIRAIAVTNEGVLTFGADTLITEYNFSNGSGGALTNGDAPGTWLTPSAYLAKDYSNDGGDNQILELDVRAGKTGTWAPAGLYDCKILLRATW